MENGAGIPGGQVPLQLLNSAISASLREIMPLGLALFAMTTVKLSRSMKFLAETQRTQRKPGNYMENGAGIPGGQISLQLLNDAISASLREILLSGAAGCN